MNIQSIFVTITIFVAAINVESKIESRIQKITCNVHDPLAIDLKICSVKAINRTTTLINIEANITRPLTSFLFTSQLYKKSEIKYRPFLVNVTDDFCQFMSKKKAGAYFRIIWPIISPYTNMNHECPYFGMYYIKDLPIDDEKLPSIWPNGNFLLDVSISGANRKNILTAHTYFELKQRRIE